MMRTALLALLLCAPLLASAQDLPEDRDCTDFDTRMQAQGWYLAMQQLSDEEDPHRLDADGNGVACESIAKIQADSLSDLSGAYTDLHSRLQRVVCPDTSFALQDFVKETRRGFRGEGSHIKWTTMVQCVELHLSLRQNQ
jgi:hypothetical protein